MFWSTKCFMMCIKQDFQNYLVSIDASFSNIFNLQPTDAYCSEFIIQPRVQLRCTRGRLMMSVNSVPYPGYLAREKCRAL